MDTNNWRPTPPGGEPTMDTGDLRTQLQPDSRQRIVNKIMDTLKRHLPFSGQEGLNELRKIAVRFEEKIFTAASSESDYLRRISLKMLTMETKSPNPISNAGNTSKPPDPAQQTMLNSLPPGSSSDSAQGNALGSMQQVAPGPLQQNPVSTYQQANINSLSSQSGLSVLQQNMNPLQSNSNILQHQHLKQQQEQQQILQSQKYKQQFQQRQMQQRQYMHRQKQQVLQQQQQQHQQAKQQLPTQLQTQQMPQLHQMNDVNDMRPGMGLVKPGVFQHLPAGQRQSYTHEQLKQGGQFPISSPQLLQAVSPQMPQHSSPQIDQQSLLTSISKIGTPLQSANSPFIVPSPSTPLAPSPTPGESEKPVPGSSTLSNAANVGHQQGTGFQGIGVSPGLLQENLPTGQLPGYSQEQSKPGAQFLISSPLLFQSSFVPSTSNLLTPSSTAGNSENLIYNTEQEGSECPAPGTPYNGTPTPPLLAGLKNANVTRGNALKTDCGKSNVMDQRHDPRVTMAKPMSLKSLSTSVVTMVDEATAAVGEDLAAVRKRGLHARSFFPRTGLTEAVKMRCFMSAVVTFALIVWCIFFLNHQH